MKEGGFDILTEIDVKEKLKKIFNAEFRRYIILESFNPTFADKASTEENNIGTMLSCDVIVQEISDGQVKVAAIDPRVSIQAVENPNLNKLTAEIGNKLRTIIDRA